MRTTLIPHSQNTLRAESTDDKNGQASERCNFQPIRHRIPLACLIPTCWRDSPPQEERTCGRLFRLPSETCARCKLLAPLRRRRPTYLTKNGAFTSVALISASHMTASAPSFIPVLTTPFAACQRVLCCFGVVNAREARISSSCLLTLGAGEMDRDSYSSM